MLKSLEQIFEKESIEINESGDRIPLHSNTSREQGLFLQKIFDQIKPLKSLEVGFAYGISSLFILEKHRENGSCAGAHLVIEPDNYWGNAAVFNIEKEGLSHFLQIQRDYSDKVLTKLYHENYRIQYAYIDTTKQFDVIMQDFYFINKILDVGGVVILDDCGGECPGVQRVARFINTLPHYKVFKGHNEYSYSFSKKVAIYLLSIILNIIPFKRRLYETIDIKTNKDLGLNYSCIAFIKLEEDRRNWNWDKPF